jgi:hypothetical protein
MRLALVAQLLACSSEYMPRRPHHVAVVMRNGKPVYVRDGRTFEPGLGGGLVEAVQGNPTAVAAAEELRSRQITGLVSMLLGTAAAVGGITWGTALAVNDRPNSQFAVPGALLIGGLVAMMVGTCYFATAQPYQWDAINIYNDGVDNATPTFGPPGPPGYTSVNERANDDASLRMRDR